MLYTQLSEMVMKIMTKKKNMNFSDFFKNHELTKNVSDYFKNVVDFTLETNLPQRKFVDLGKIISKVVAADHVAQLGAKGFRSDLINDSLETIKHEISMLVSSYKFQTNVSPTEEYQDQSSWLAFS
jgi:hypothetical protein